MKKSNILIAALMGILASVSIARAEEFKMDFDKGAYRSDEFMMAAKASDVPKIDNTANMRPTPAADCAINVVVHKLTAPGLKELREEILNMPGLSEDLIRLLNDDKIVVLHNTQGVFLTTQVGKDSYYTLFESNDKKLIEFLSKQKTEAVQAELQNKGWVKICLPVAKTLWKWLNGVWTAYEVTEYLCHQEWEDDSSGGNGNGAIPYIPVNPPVRK